MRWTDFIVPIDHTYKDRAAESIWAAELAAYQPNTLCELCENACGFCRWSEKFVQAPVEGWEAIRSDIVENDGRELQRKESYVVVSCPEFVLTPRCERYLKGWSREAAERHINKRKNANYQAGKSNDTRQTQGT